MSDLAGRHRRITDVVEPLERMGVEATVDERATDEGDLCLTLDLRIPPALDSLDGSEATEGIEVLEAQCERLREERDEARERVEEVLRRAEDLEAHIAELEDRDEGSEPVGADGPDAEGGEEPAASRRNLTEGERETLDALRELGGFRASGEIADEVDATLQSVRSWLPKLAQADHIRAEPDPTDGRRKLYSPVESDDEESDDADGTVYIASNGGSPSQVFHVREDCPQLQKSTDFVEKDRSVVPHHRPCGNCVPEGLEEGLVAIAKGSPTTTYHKREDCPKLGSARNVAVQSRETVPNHDPCDDCVHQDGEEGTGGGDEADDGPPPAQICARNDLRREEIVEALDAANAIYHVQRDLTLSRDETEALLQGLGVFEDLAGGGHVTPDRAKSVVRKRVPPAKQLEADGGEYRD